MNEHPSTSTLSNGDASFRTLSDGGGAEFKEDEEEETTTDYDNEEEQLLLGGSKSSWSSTQASLSSFSPYLPSSNGRLPAPGSRPLMAYPSPVHAHNSRKQQNGDARINITKTSSFSETAESWQIEEQTNEQRTDRKKARYPREFLKLVTAFFFMLFSMIMTGISLALVHEKRPEIDPLPDQILDRVAYQKWALFGSEHLIQFQSFTAAIVIIFHRHRFIVLRRVMLIIGVLYLYRSLTMWVTALPKADPNYECAPKINGTIPVSVVAVRTIKILTGMGLSVNGKHVFCGDYIYSGHTMMIIIGHLIIREYTPKRFFALHWLTWFNACTSIILLLLSRGHYTIDVIIAYVITTRLWAIYHTIAGHVALKQSTPLNHFSQFWWFDPVRWFEANVKAGKVPNEYNWPLPVAISKFLRSRIRRCCKRTAMKKPAS